MNGHKPIDADRRRDSRTQRKGGLKDMETIFITGVDKGLGLALARRFLRAGFMVLGGVYAPPWAASPLLREEYPETLFSVDLDVADMDSVRRAARAVAERVRSLDILINNAAVYLEDKKAPLEALDLADGRLERTMAVNAFGPLRVTQQFLPLLRRGSRKMLINISSEAGSVGAAERSREFAYCMSKSALNIQTKLLDNYLRPDGFTVLAIHPGWMRTDMGGPEADLPPESSAAGIFALATRARRAEEPIYLDYQGNPLIW